MADDVSSSTSGDPNSNPKKSVHKCLGGGPVADILLWKRRNVCILILVLSTTCWFLFDRTQYSFLSFVANVLLLLVSILFLWSKSASLLKRPPPPLPNLEVSEACVEKAAESARLYINSLLSLARDITLKKDIKLLMKVILVLWVFSYVGSLFSFLTFAYIGTVMWLTIPALYDKYQDHIDEKVSITHNAALERCRSIKGTVLSKIPGTPMKGKKVE